MPSHLASHGSGLAARCSPSAQARSSSPAASSCATAGASGGVRCAQVTSWPNSGRAVDRTGSRGSRCAGQAGAGRSRSRARTSGSRLWPGGSRRSGSGMADQSAGDGRAAATARWRSWPCRSARRVRQARISPSSSHASYRGPAAAHRGSKPRPPRRRSSAAAAAGTPAPHPQSRPAPSDPPCHVRLALSRFPAGSAAD